MASYQFEDLIISPECRGAREYATVSYPIRYGRYAQIETEEYVYQFAPGGDIKFIRGRAANWPPGEWLKRTAGNDWVYYSAEGYNSVRDLIGEYYLPCFSYSKNPASVANPFGSPQVQSALDSLETLAARIGGLGERGLPRELRNFISLARSNTKIDLARRAALFHEIIGSPVSVLPPDTRRVDYDVIPIVIADGCLYNCGFCSVKSGRGFKKRGPDNVRDQIRALNEFFGPDISNYNSVFLGQHDALQAGPGAISFAAREAYDAFRLGESYMKGANLFIFGSVGSFLGADESLFSTLDSLPYSTYVNIGLESADQATLEELGKPVSAARVRDAFLRMNEVNRGYERIEVTANFVLGGALSENHFDSIIGLSSGGSRRTGKGAVYLSPLDDGEAVRDVRKRIYHIKNNSMIPAYLYLIQRL